MKIKLIIKRSLNYLAYTFIDIHKGDKRLNIVAHGSDFSSQPKEICFGKWINARSLYLEIIKDREMYCCKNIRLLSCHSADGFSLSFACQLSQYLPDKMVKGYAGEIKTNFSPDIMKEIIQTEGVDILHSMISENDRVKLEKVDTHFHSVTFKNGRCIKQNYGIVTLNRRIFITL